MIGHLLACLYSGIHPWMYLHPDAQSILIDRSSARQLHEHTMYTRGIRKGPPNPGKELALVVLYIIFHE